MRNVLLILFIAFVTSLQAQVPVSTQKEKKNVLLEYVPGIRCPWCPLSELYADQYTAEFGKDNLYLLAFHGWGFASPPPDLRTEFIDSLLNYRIRVNAVPCGFLNRKHVDCMDYRRWYDSIPQFYWEETPINIGVESYFNEGDSNLIINVALYFTENVKTVSGLHVAIAQDSIIAPQSGGSTHYPDRVLPDGNYLHMNVFREMLTPLDGKTILPGDSGNRVDLKFTYAVEQIRDIEPNIGNMNVIVYVTESDSGWTDIYTVGKSKALERPLKVEQIDQIQNIQLYPNPANAQTKLVYQSIRSEHIQVNIMDLRGSLVQQFSFTSNPGMNKQNINLESIQSGLYVLTISTEDEVHVKHLVVE